VEEYRDFPFEKMCEQAHGLIRQGMLVYQKFTCSTCGQRLAMEKPNVFFEEGTCDRCGSVTDIKRRGCNYATAITYGVKVKGGENDAKQSQGDNHNPDGKRAG
jgi:predicted RNA-binding Zn-ribbon protein involved in translation (DUF1610 family)